MSERLTLKLEVLTPLFMGDADQTQATLRPPSIKGLLRFWYRAAVLDTRQEGALFGSTRHGQCPFLLRFEEEARTDWRWDRRWVARFDHGEGHQARNGLRYLGYPFDLAERNEAGRAAIGPGSRYRLEFVFPRGSQPHERRALLASVWLLGHLGGAGSRARRGFGSLVLRDWQIPEAWSERDQLALLHGRVDRSGWSAGLAVARTTIAAWLQEGESPAADPVHPHLGRRTRLHLGPGPARDWAAALERAGLALQSFRLRREPDYGAVKDDRSGQRRLERCPERAAFGLPLSFRYGPLPNARPVTFVPYDEANRTTLERHGSPLWIRIVALADGLYPLFVRLDGATPGTPELPVAVRGEGRALRPARADAIDAFMDYLERELR